MSPNLAKALLAFADGTFLYVHLGRLIEASDNVLVCSNVIGPPEGATQDKAGMAQSILRLKSVANGQDLIIPMSRITAVKIIEDATNPITQVKKDIEDLWK